MGFIKASCCPGLPPEPLLEDLIVGEIRGKDLQGNHAVDSSVVDTPYLTHSAPAQQLHQAVAPKRRPVH